MKQYIPALALLIVAGTAQAATVSGPDALALGAIVGGYSPRLGAPQKAVLAKVLDGGAAAVAGAGKVVVTAQAIRCTAGNVDIARFACELSFGGAAAHLAGRRAHEMFATLLGAGVVGEGAAGSIHADAYRLKCTIDPAAVAGKDGGGAACDYGASGP